VPRTGWPGRSSLPPSDSRTEFRAPGHTVDVLVRPVARRGGLAVLAALLAVTGCSVDRPAPAPAGSGPPPASAPAPARPSPRPTVSPTPATPRTQPLALVVHATRPVVDVSEAAARRVITDRPDRWSAVGQAGGRMRLVSFAPGTSARVLQAVRASRDVLGVLPAADVDPTVRVLTVAGRHPLRDPGEYALQVPAAGRPPEVTTLSIVGDVMLARRVGRSVAADPRAPFRPLARRLSRAEITVGNLESTLSTAGTATQGGDSFGATPRVLAGPASAGFDLVSLANNHVGDYGDRALRQTLDRLRSADLPYVGAGRTLAEARRPVVLARDGVRVGFLATDSIGETPAATSRRAGTNRLDMPPRTGPLDRAALRRITGDIRRLKRRVDVVVVVPHWGTQYTHRPEPSQRTAAAAFARAGADLVVGGHPHWVQGWERVGSSTVVHSLGNFVFDMDFSTKTREGVFVEVTLWGGRVVAVEPVPYVIDDEFAPRPVRGDRAQRILDDVWSTSRGPYAVPGR
jgi:poly-gamma-glutamate capsule biosynthesis protein CapA/YwtB (metallophosphatase superfamily)